mmetsp:Transcript_18588/g.28928  ORF Transcript_18588/g.28928 Transcript_18588/m.28928 type:complete len:667 (+) Transcript_18588:2197-4197(+)
MKDFFLGTFYRGNKIIVSTHGEFVFFPSGKYISKASLNKFTIETLDYCFRDLILEFDIDQTGKILFVIDNSDLFSMVDIENKKILHRVLTRRKVMGIKISPRNRYLVIQLERNFQIWKFSLLSSKSCLQLCKSTKIHRQDIKVIEWDETGNYLISLGFDNVLEIITFRDIEPKIKISFPGFAREVSCISFLYEEKSILILNNNGKLLLLDVKKLFGYGAFNRILKLNKLVGKIEVNLLTNSHISSSSLNKKCGKILIGTFCGEMKIIDFRKIFHGRNISGRQKYPFFKKKNEFSFKVHQKNPSVRHLILSPFYPYIIAVVGKEDSIFIFDMYRQRNIFIHGNYIAGTFSFDISANGLSLCTGNSRGLVCNWLLRNGTCSLKFNNHLQSVNGVKYLKNNSRLTVTCSQDGTIKLLDFKKGAIIKIYFNQNRKNSYNLIEIDPSNRFFAVSCRLNFSIYIWNLKSGKILRILKGHNSILSAFFFQDLTSNFATISDDDSIRLWRLEGGNSKRLTKSRCYYFSSKIVKWQLIKKKNLMVLLTIFFELIFFDLDNLQIKKKIFLWRMGLVKKLNYTEARWNLVRREKNHSHLTIFFHYGLCLIRYSDEKQFLHIERNFPPDPIAKLEKKNYQEIFNDNSSWDQDLKPLVISQRHNYLIICRAFSIFFYSI